MIIQKRKKEKKKSKTSTVFCCNLERNKREEARKQREKSREVTATKTVHNNWTTDKMIWKRRWRHVFCWFHFSFLISLLSCNPLISIKILLQDIQQCVFLRFIHTINACSFLCFAFWFYSSLLFKSFWLLVVLSHLFRWQCIDLNIASICFE